MFVGGDSFAQGGKRRLTKKENRERFGWVSPKGKKKKKEGDLVPPRREVGGGTKEGKNRQECDFGPEERGSGYDQRKKEPEPTERKRGDGDREGLRCFKRGESRPALKGEVV